MSKRKGWVGFHRKMLDNPIVNKSNDHFAVWARLLLEATHKEYEVVFGGKAIKLQPGQLITGRHSLAKKCRVNNSKVERILKLFESAQQIEQQTSNKNRLITVKNWIKYRKIEQQNEQQANNKPLKSEHKQECINKNVYKQELNFENLNNFAFSEQAPPAVDLREENRPSNRERAMEALRKANPSAYERLYGKTE